MKRSSNSTYALRKRGLPNFRSRASAHTAPLTGASSALTPDYERQRVNFEQRRLEHLRESWRVQGAL